MKMYKNTRIQTVTLFESFFVIIIYMALEYLYCLQVRLVEIMLQLDCCSNIILLQLIKRTQHASQRCGPRWVI